MSDEARTNTDNFMSEKSVGLTPKISHYLNLYGRKIHPEVIGLREDSFSKRSRNIRMLLEPTTCSYIEHQLRSLKGIRAIEVGTFTGVTALAMALAIQHNANTREIPVVDVLENFITAQNLPSPAELLPNCDDKDTLAIQNPTAVISHIAKHTTADTPLMLTFDVNAENITDVSISRWKKANTMYSPLVFVEGSAISSLEQLVSYESLHNTFDMVFIDAAKSEYDQYYELSLKLIRPGGYICVDNVIWGGRTANYALNDDLSVRTEEEIANGPEFDKATIALHKFNAKIVDDQRVDAIILPIGDGLSVCRKL